MTTQFQFLVIVLHSFAMRKHSGDMVLSSDLSIYNHNFEFHEYTVIYIYSNNTYYGWNFPDGIPGFFFASMIDVNR